MLEYVNGFDVGHTNQGSLVNQDAYVGVRVEDASPMPLNFIQRGVHVLGGCPSTGTGCMYGNKLSCCPSNSVHVLSTGSFPILAGKEVSTEDAETQDDKEVLPEDAETDGAGELLLEDAKIDGVGELLPEGSETDDGDVLPEDAETHDDVEVLLEDAKTGDVVDVVPEDAQSDDGVEVLPEDAKTDDSEEVPLEDAEVDVLFVPDSMPAHGGDSLGE